jgi:predicted TIM-barrel fold metal-dependent hydrolase
MAPDVLIDCDVHNTVLGPRLARELPARWRRQYEDIGFLRPNTSTGYVRPRAFAQMADAWPPGGGMPGSDRAFMTEQLLDAWGHTYAILNPGDQMNLAVQPGEYGAALERALNDVVESDWLEPEPRFYAAISVPFEDPDLAVAEIERRAGNPRFVQVLINAVTSAPLGNRRYWPIYEAVQAHDLPVAVHVAGGSGHPMTGCGWPSFYFEDHVTFQQPFLDHVVSLVGEGVFDRFPRLKVVLVEGGFAWLPSLMDRMDNAYGLLREHMPPLERRPSEYCREHLWFTTQPIEEPERPRDLERVLARMEMDDRLLFSTDYPHWDFDAPDRAIPSFVPDRLRQAILADNALGLYRRLPAP